MATTLRMLAVFAGCGAPIAFAAEPNEPPKPKVEIRWVERYPVKELTLDRSAHNGSDTRNDYYPHIKPAMILGREDVSAARMQKVDWEVGGKVVHHYVVTLELTKEARVRLAKSCPGKTARITVAVDGHYWGWDHYATDDAADVADRWKAKNYSPCMGLMPRADAERIVNAFK